MVYVIIRLYSVLSVHGDCIEFFKGSSSKDLQFKNFIKERRNEMELPKSSLDLGSFLVGRGGGAGWSNLTRH